MPDRLRIGVDLDGVVYRFSDTANYLVKAHFGIDMPEWSHWDFPMEYLESIGRADVWKWLWKEGVERGLFRYGSIYKGSREALIQLAELGDLVVITARPKTAVNDTLEWLAYQRFPTSEVHILSGAPKSSVKCDVYIDDSADNHAELVNNAPSSLVLLMDRPWNKDHNTALRVNGWDEAIARTRAEYLDFTSSLSARS